MSLEKVPKAAWIAAGAVVLLVAVALILLLTQSSSGDDVEFTGSGLPGVDLANTRDVESEIDSSNVNELDVAWTLPLTGEGAYGSHASTPIITNGVVYSQDLASNVQAIDFESGEVLWEKKFDEPSHGPNGLAVANGLVYGATASDAFALKQKTGELHWLTPLLRQGGEGIDMAPGYHDGRVFISTVPVSATSTYEPGGVGVLWALKADSGEPDWKFYTVPESLWGNPKVNSGGGLWYPPSFDGKGSMYVGTGNPGPLPGTAKFPWGSSRPGRNLYADSMVKLDEKTGKVEWHYQQTPHNLFDWDFQNPPILIEAGGKDLAIGSGKSGVVVAVDTESGKPVWKRPVGTHNGHDDDPLYAMRGEYEKLKTPAEVFPGTLGGVIAPMATNGSTLFVPIVNHSMTVSSPSEITESSAATGELVALDVATGSVKWKKQLPQPAYGAPTVVNDLVFQTTAEGVVYGLDAESGGEVWQTNLPAGSNVGVMAHEDTLIAPAGLPIAEGQVPEIVAYRLGG